LASRIEPRWKSDHGSVAFYASVFSHKDAFFCVTKWKIAVQNSFAATVSTHPMRRGGFPDAVLIINIGPG
jgi:hypothetical protein